MQKDFLDALQGTWEIVQPGRAQLRFLGSAVAMSDEKLGKTWSVSTDNTIDF